MITLNCSFVSVRKGFTVVLREPAAQRGSCMRQAVAGYQVLMMVIASVGQSKVPLEG